MRSDSGNFKRILCDFRFINDESFHMQNVLHKLQIIDIIYKLISEFTGGWHESADEG